MILKEFWALSIIQAALKKKKDILFPTLNTAKAAKMCRNPTLAYQKLMWVDQAKHQVIPGKYKQDSAACNFCSYTKLLFFFFTEVKYRFG